MFILFLKNSISRLFHTFLFTYLFRFYFHRVRGNRKNLNHRNLPKSPLKSGVGGDMGFGGAGRDKVGYVCIKVGWVLIT